MRRAIKLAFGLLPPAIREGLRELRDLGGIARLEWLRLSLGLQREKVAEREPEAIRAGDRLLFVCFGNIYRSAFAEQVLRVAIDSSAGVHVESAGLHATLGERPPADARAVAEELGYSLTQHRAKPVTADLIAAATTVFVMDKRNAAEILSQFPEHRQKIRALGSFSSADTVWISDPYARGRDSVRTCFTRIEEAIRNLTALSDRPK